MLDRHRRAVGRFVTDRVSRVRGVVEAARAIAHDSALFEALLPSTGLSREGVRLALDEHLELEPSDEELARLIASTTPCVHVHVILSANVFVGALRAIAIARASSERVTVRPSSREPHFASALVQAIGHPDVQLSGLAPSEGEIHVYGHDETITDVVARAASGVVVRGHGAGLGVALIDVEADLQACARSLARDVVPFDQRGCLSPRVAFVTGAERSRAFSDALHAELEEAEVRVPRGRQDDREAEELERYASTVAYAGSLSRGRANAVGRSTTVIVPPPGRNVHVVEVAGELGALLDPITRWVVAVGASDLSWARSIAPVHARVSKLGAMQRPPLDGPVDLRR